MSAARPGLNDVLALDRTRRAAERTLDVLGIAAKACLGRGPRQGARPAYLPTCDLRDLELQRQDYGAFHWRRPKGRYLPIKDIPSTCRIGVGEPTRAVRRDWPESTPCGPSRSTRSARLTPDTAHWRNGSLAP
jgi:hypothetical protein